MINASAKCLVGFIAGLLFVTSTALGQQRMGSGFDAVTIDDGLSQAAVHAIVQDHYGYMWFGTQEGLNRFDGYEFRTFIHDSKDPNSIGSDWIWDIVVDDQGDLWIATGTGGLNHYSYETNSFRRFEHDAGDPTSVSDSALRQIYRDKQGRYWIATESSGIDLFDPQNETFTHIRHDPAKLDSLSSNRVRTIVETYDGMIWAGTSDAGINAIDPDSLRVSRRPLLNATNDSSKLDVVAMIAPGDGTIWVATYESGLFLYDPGSRRSIHFAADKEDPASISSNSLRALYLDARNDLWVGTDGDGLNRLDPVTRKFEHYDAPDDLVNGDITRIYQDTGGVIWVGSYAGLNKWNPAQRQFDHINQSAESTSQLSNNNIHSLAADDSENLWVGTYGGGLERLNRATGSRVTYQHDPDNSDSLSDNRVMALALNESNGVWVGTYAGGLNYLDLETHAIRRYSHDPEVPGSLAGDGVTSLLTDANDDLWVGTYGGGLSLLNPATGQFTHYQNDPADETSISSDQVLSIEESRDGSLWIGTFGGGLNLFDKDTKQFVSYWPDEYDENSISSDKAWAIHEDPAGNVWVGTMDAGLNLWRVADRDAGIVKFQRYGRSEGLRSKMIYAVRSDSKGDIWMSSNTGLARLEPDTGYIRHFTTNEGLQSEEFNFAAAAGSSTGELFFGGINGLNAFDPLSIQINRNVPPIRITDIYKLNKKLNTDTAIESLSHLELAYTDYVVAFEFAALDFTSSELNQYEYMLEGLDEDWVPFNGVRRATYTSLSSGNYVFRVRGSNNDNVWNEVGASLALQVQPPPWRTWWAWMIYALAVISLVLWGIRVQWSRARRAEQLNRTNQRLELEIETRVARERAIEQQKRIAQRYLDVVEVIMIALDDQGLVTLINQKGCNVLGYTEEEILGRQFLANFVPRHESSEAQLPFGKIDESGYSESKVLSRGGSERTIAWHTARLPEQDGQSGNTLSSGTDITEIRTLEMQLQQSQKMDALGAIASGVAHDFNNVLASILGFSELAMTRLEPESKAYTYIRQSVKSVEHGRELISRILAFSRKDEATLEAVYLQKLMNEAVELLRPGIPLNVKLRTTIEEDCGPVLANPSDLRQVIMNLGTNACHAMAAGSGDLTFSLKSIQGSEGHPHVRISVADTGPGIAPENMDKIFDPFFTTKEKGKGTGLGLAMAHSTINRMGGEMRVESSLGFGATFEIDLPCCADGEEPTISLPDFSETPHIDSADRGCAEGLGESILFVDDDQTILLLTETILVDSGFNVVCRTNAKDALKYFWQNRESVDLVLTDYIMPGMDGLELAEEIRAIDPLVPIVLASGQETPEPKDRINAHLMKPIRTTTLLQTLRRVLDEKQGMLTEG